MKKSMKIIPLLVMIFLVSLSYACAADADGNNLTDSDVLTGNDDDMGISQANNEEIVKSTNVSSKTFSELSKEINKAEEGSEIILTEDCEYDSGITFEGISIKKQLTIDGNGHTINGKDSARAFFIDANNVVLKNINFINGNSRAHGGGTLLIRASNIVIENCTFKNSKDVYGGAIYMTEHTKSGLFQEVKGAKIINCKFESNTAEKGGGAIYALSKENTITNCEFKSNRASMGGAVQIGNSKNNKIINNKFTSNSAKSEGGALALMYTSNEIVKDNVFEKNSATKLAGAFEAYRGSNYTVTNNRFNSNNGGDLAGAMRLSINSSKTTSKITNNKFTNNKAKNAGALYSNGDKATFTKNTFTSNEATEKSGGAIFIDGNSNTISENTISKCSAGYKGGAISIKGDSNSIVKNNITSCKSKEGGGAIYIWGSKATINSNNIKSCEAETSGGAILVSGDKATIKSNTISSNTAKNHGGALYVTGNNAVITSNKFTSNKVTAKSGTGGAIRLNGNYAKITSNTFTKNSAKNGPSVYIQGYEETISKNKFTGSTMAKQVVWKIVKQKTKITAPTKKFKRSAVKKVVITLKSAAGKKLASKYIYLKINAKNYKAKTNKNGQATFKITNINKKAIFIYVVRFKGDKYYYAVKNSGRIRVI